MGKLQVSGIFQWRLPGVLVLDVFPLKMVHNFDEFLEDMEDSCPKLHPKYDYDVIAQKVEGRWTFLRIVMIFGSVDGKTFQIPLVFELFLLLTFPKNQFSNK